MTGIKYDFSNSLDISKTCIHCQQDVLSHGIAHPFYCISPDRRTIYQTFFTTGTKMLSFYQLNDFHRDVVTLVEAAEIITAWAKGDKDSLSYMAIPSQLTEHFEAYCSDDKEIRKSGDSNKLFALIYRVRCEADAIARKQNYSENYPFTDKAERLGFVRGVNHAD